MTTVETRGQLRRCWLCGGPWSGRARPDGASPAWRAPWLTLSAIAVVVGQLAPRERADDVLLLAPSVFLAVAVVALIAPLVAGGGNELFPEEQLVAFPVTPRTSYAVSLALSPLNVAWTTQLIGLFGVTSYLVSDARRAGCRSRW